jgi:hypothetical protein
VSCRSFIFTSGVAQTVANLLDQTKLYRNGASNIETKKQQARQTTATYSVAGAESAPSLSPRSDVDRLNMNGFEPNIPGILVSQREKMAGSRSDICLRCNLSDKRWQARRHWPPDSNTLMKYGCETWEKSFNHLA